MRIRLVLLAGTILGLSACQTEETPVSEAAVQAPPATARNAGSCGGEGYAAPNEIAIAASPVPLAPEGEEQTLPAGISFAGGWHLTSGNASFGGLSGIEVLPDGNLLTVVDDGAFVWIGLNDGAPSGNGQIAYMRGADGKILQGKSEADSEGLALKAGVAYVSFERHHRIEAFDLATCGANALAGHVADLPDSFGNGLIDENRGAEALAWTPVLEAGFEVLEAGQSPSVRLTDGSQDISLIDPPGPGYDHPVVGMANAVPVSDNGTEESWVYRLRRNYNPLFGNTLGIEVRRTDAEGSGQTGLFVLKRPMNVDNFEGIAAAIQPDGTHRLWLVADNNFSDRQRTLLFAFDVDPAAIAPAAH